MYNVVYLKFWPFQQVLLLLQFINLCVFDAVLTFYCFMRQLCLQLRKQKTEFLKHWLCRCVLQHNSPSCYHDYIHNVNLDMFHSESFSVFLWFVSCENVKRSTCWCQFYMKFKVKTWISSTEANMICWFRKHFYKHKEAYSLHVGIKQLANRLLKV